MDEKARREEAVMVQGAIRSFEAKVAGAKPKA
jgi:hypothetical protein